MSLQEAANQNTPPLLDGWVVLQKVEADIAAQAVQSQVDTTSSSIRVWLWVWPFIESVDPAKAIAELGEMRAANDNHFLEIVA